MSYNEYLAENKRLLHALPICAKIRYQRAMH